MNICIIVPTYNNAGTIMGVLQRLKPFATPIVVVNDGSTDQTLSLISVDDKWWEVISYEHNQGKGYALREGFKWATAAGYDYAITIDSDGQHYPEDLPLFFEAIERNPGALIVGNRKLQQKNMPKGNTFANHFSNFWFALQTWHRLPDTQTGYRAYPLKQLRGLRFLTCRYEAELELLVWAAWGGVRLTSTPIRVYYPPVGERVTHYRPILDFLRISILNTVLCIMCICYGWWAMLFYAIKRCFK